MGDGNWFGKGRKRSRGVKRQASDRSKLARKFAARDRGLLSFEALEDRRMLAAYLVNNSGDLDQDANVVIGTLRWAVGRANATAGFDTIVFADNVSSIFLDPRDNGGQLTITEGVEILGPGARKLTVTQTKANQRIFETKIGADDEAFGVEISGMTLTGGNVVGTGDDRRGGAIFNREHLVMNEVVVRNNSASRGGGGIYTDFGSLTLESSLIQSNSSNVGGGIMNGAEGDEKRPRTTINNSTITGNTAFGGGPEQYPVGYGGGLFNRNGRMTIVSSTITRNNSEFGAGVASWGNPVPEEEGGDPPAPTVFTVFSHSIVVGNNAGDDGGDIDRVGKEGEGEEEVDLEPSINVDDSPGYNIVGTGNATVAGPDIAFVNDVNGNKIVADPTTVLQLNFDPDVGYGGLRDYGGSTDVFLLAPNSPAIDGGDPGSEEEDPPRPPMVRDQEQRGRHFTGVFNDVIDVGAVEMQSGVFVVDTLVDETDRIYSFVSKVTFEFGQQVISVGYYDLEGDFSIREAIEFATKNPGLDTILFSNELNTKEVLDAEDLTVSPAPTILLTLGQLVIDEALIVQGPGGFVLEIDASGNDPTPNQNEGNGSRVLLIDDGGSSSIDVSISNLTLMGGDIVGAIGGGGVLSRENLTLKNSTIKDNSATNSGGGLYAAAGTTILEGVTLNNNRASNDGGALFVNPLADLVKISNSTFSGNFAQDKGGAIFNDASDVAIGYSTITLNSAGSLQGSGIYNNRATPPVPAMTAVYSTIISNNAASDVSFSAGATANSFESAGHNLVGTGLALSRFNQPTDVQSTNPQLGPLTNTGGIVLTHRPLVGSPAIDAGPPQAPPGGGGFVVNQPQFDQRLFPFLRVIDGDFDGVALIDIGAYEVQSAVFEVDNRTDENDGNYSTGDLSLREAILLANENPFADTITFKLVDSFGNDLFVPGITVSLSFFLSPGTPADMRITDSVTIVGNDFTIDAGSLDNPSDTITGSRVFTIDDGDAGHLLDVTFSGLEIINAEAPQAGSVFWSNENLTLDGITLVNNRTFDDPADTSELTGLHGGAIYQQTGLLRIIGESLITGNVTDDVNADGGAIYVLNGSLHIENSTVAGNATLKDTSRGGGIALKNSTFTGSAVTIAGNSTALGASDGGGLFSSGSTVTLSNGSVVGGNSTIGTTSEGGGISAIDSSVTLNDSVVSQNTTIGTQSAGAGIFISGGALTMNRSVLALNLASGAQSSGGGLAMLGGVATFDTASIELNRVTALGSHGGGIYNVGGTLIVRNSTVHSNEASHAQSKGGGVYSDTNMVVGAGSQVTTLLNSTVSGNLSGLRGGGVFNADGQLEIRHSTITNNTTPFMNVGAGVASQGNPALPPPPAGPLPATTRTTVYSSIIAGNVGAAAGTSTDVDVVDGGFQNSFVSLGANLIGTGNALPAFGAADIKNNTAPLLGALADNDVGGAMLYQLLTHEPLINSPAVDAGAATAVSGVNGVPATDQRGAPFSRVYNGDGVGTSRIDIGAVERQPISAAADFSGDDIVDGTDFLLWQRQVGTPNATKANGDADGDKDVDSIDLSILKSTFGGSLDPVSVVAAISASVVTVSEDESLSEDAAADVPVYSATASTDSPASADAAAVAGLGTPGTLLTVAKQAHARKTTADDHAMALRDATFAGLT